MKAKKVFSALACVLLTLTTGCSSASNGAGSPKASNADSNTNGSNELADATISILSRSFTPKGQITFETGYKQLEEWKLEHPNITVVNDSVFDEDQFNNKFTIAVSSGEIPTIISTYGGGAFKSYVESGMVLDLDPYLDADPKWRDSFKTGAFSTVQYADIPGTYGIPLDMFATGIFYNKTIFEECGVEVPTTIAEFEEVCDTLLEHGYIPMAFGDKNSYRGGHLIGDFIMKRYGSKFLNELASGERSYTDPEFIEVLSRMKSWQDKGYLGGNVVTLDVDGERTLFRTGKSAMSHHMVTQYGNMMTGGTVTDDEVGLFQFPYFEEAPENRNAWHAGPSLMHAISADASDEEIAAAISLLKKYTSLESAAEQVERGGGAFLSILKDAPTSENPVPALQDFSKAYANVTDTGKEPGEYEVNSALRNVIRDQIQAMFAGATPKEVASAIQAVKN